MKTPEDEEFERIEAESGWRKRQIMAEDDDDIQDYKKPWVGLTDEEIDQGLLRTKYAMQTAGAWRDGVEWAIKQLQEKNT